MVDANRGIAKSTTEHDSQVSESAGPVRVIVGNLDRIRHLAMMPRMRSSAAVRAPVGARSFGWSSTPRRCVVGGAGGRPATSSSAIGGTARQIRFHSKGRKPIGSSRHEQPPRTKYEIALTIASRMLRDPPRRLDQRKHRLNNLPLRIGHVG
ncbi:hypothetical protein Aca07nite_38920 [Actinoplanes capillaceus]|uniref:Uncharacterized protein n=1 Tax=Actinoplanes campanulatus TaxID=113559 RepID=A0ABQ3WK45_9ACTN|nr:hypothetical protein Aca07nite_38920 [Actinoplanes capillaceus]